MIDRHDRSIRWAAGDCGYAPTHDMSFGPYIQTEELVCIESLVDISGVQVRGYRVFLTK